MTRAAFVFVFITLCVADFGTVASAQDVESARALFDDARVDFEAGRFLAARDKLERSLELAPRSGTAMNLARALRSLGEPLEAERLIERLLEGMFGDVPEERRLAARELLSDVRAEAGAVRVTFAGRPRASLEIDGLEVAEIAEGEMLERRVNPGRHRVGVLAVDGARDVEQLTLGPGDAISVDLLIPPVVVDDDTRGPSPAPRRGWIWAVAAVVLAGAVTAVIVTQVDRTSDPVMDDVFPIAGALQRR